MIVNGEWIDSDDWLIEKLRIIRQTYDEISDAVASGDISEHEARNAFRYIEAMELNDKSPDKYWQSSSYNC